MEVGDFLTLVRLNLGEIDLYLHEELLLRLRLENYCHRRLDLLADWARQGCRLVAYM